MARKIKRCGSRAFFDGIGRLRCDKNSGHRGAWHDCHYSFGKNASWENRRRRKPAAKPGKEAK